VTRSKDPSGTGDRDPIIALRIELARPVDQRLRRIDADGRDAEFSHHAAEATFAAADIERCAGRLAADASHHRRVENEAAAIVAELSLLVDPGLSGGVPASRRIGYHRGGLLLGVALIALAPVRIRARARSRGVHPAIPRRRADCGEAPSTRY
jgi:hypothetical protein